MKKALFFLLLCFTAFCAMAQVKQEISYDVSSKDSVIVVKTITVDILENVTMAMVDAKITELQKQADDFEKKRAEVLGHINTFQSLRGRIEQELKTRKSNAPPAMSATPTPIPITQKQKKDGRN